LHFSWWRGFIRGVGLAGAMDDPPTAETLEALFADPHAALLADLSLVHQITETVPLWQTLVAQPRPTVRNLGASNLGDGGIALDALTRLETLHLGVDDRFDRRAHPPVIAVERLAHANLRRLSVASEHECPAAITGAVDTPNLDTLTWNEPMFRYPDVHELALFTTPSSIMFHPPPRLARLEVADVPLELLVDLPVFAQLNALGWRGGCDRVLELAPRLQHLESLSFGMAQMPAETLAAVREQLERAFPRTKLDIAWDHCIERPQPPRDETPRKPSVVDADSRDEHGRVNAITRFTQNR
jgi:hypothetical protein